MLLKGCLHVHTTCSDGKLTPRESAAAYASLGYDFIAFTDHDYLLKPDYRESYAAAGTDMIIFHGVEMTVFERGYVHVNNISGDEEELHMVCHLGEYDLGVDQVLERIEAISRTIPIHAVEITSKGFPEEKFNVDAIKYPKLATDDSHTLSGIGRGWIEMDCKRDKDSILKAIKKGRFWNCYAKGVK